MAACHLPTYRFWSGSVILGVGLAFPYNGPLAVAALCSQSAVVLACCSCSTNCRLFAFVFFGMTMAARTADGTSWRR